MVKMLICARYHWHVCFVLSQSASFPTTWSGVGVESTPGAQIDGGLGGSKILGGFNPQPSPGKSDPGHNAFAIIEAFNFDLVISKS